MKFYIWIAPGAFLIRKNQKYHIHIAQKVGLLRIYARLFAGRSSPHSYGVDLFSPRLEYGFRWPVEFSIMRSL